MSMQNQAISKTVLVPLSVMLLASLMLMTSCRAQAPAVVSPACGQSASQTVLSPVQAMQQDVSMLALVNRLSLSPLQARQLLSIASRASEAISALDGPRSQSADSLMALLQRQFDIMLRDEQPSAALMEQIAQAELELQRIDERAQEALVPFAAEARKVLSEAQVLIISGEDEARQAAEEMLMWIRELSAEDFAVEGPSNADALAVADIDLDTDTVVAIFRTARTLSAEEYAAKMDELSAKLAPLYRPDAVGEDVIIGSMLANERFAPVLQMRMEHLSDGSGQG
jgi:hypothetical protein